MSTKSKVPLQNATVLVTRPGGKGTELVEQLSTLGAEARVANILEIQLQAESAEMRAVLSEIFPSTILVFVSIHAVRAFEQTMTLTGQTLPTGVRIAAIGETTAKALKALGVEVAFSPKEQMNSEGLIASFKGVSLSNQKVILFRGQTGRTLLSDTFRDRGALVIEIEAYLRRYLKPDLGSLLSNFSAEKQRTIILTSVELLHGLIECAVDQEQRANLLSSDLVVFSQRIADAAVASGFVGRVVIAPETSNSGLVKATLSLGYGDRDS